MSKIYEALLRAEQDRAELDTNGQEPAKATTPVYSTLLQPEEPRQVADAPFAFDSTFVPAAAAPPLSTPPAFYPSMEPSAVAVAEPPPLAAPGLPPMLAGNPVVWHPDVAKLPALQSRGNQVEQFRSLRSKLFEFRDLNKLQTILVSSGLPAEGKSFVTTNLAITFARHKSSRVLLIDGDLRRSSQHKALGTTNEPGLAEYLGGKATLQQILQAGKADKEGSPLQGGLSNLSFIPSGDAGDRAADLSGSPRFAELMQTVSPHFDWIILDSSPVNLVTDAVNLARSCDGVLLIARGGVTKYESTQRALSELKASKMLGMVLNAVVDPPTADGYYGYDSYDSVKDS